LSDDIAAQLYRATQGSPAAGRLRARAEGCAELVRYFSRPPELFAGPREWKRSSASLPRIAHSETFRIESFQ